MTNAQNATYHAVKDLLAPYQANITKPKPLHEGQYASVTMEITHRGEDVGATFLIEAGGCITRILL